MTSESLGRGSILERAVVETLDKRVLLSGSPSAYLTIEAEHFDDSFSTTHAWVSYSQGGFNGSGVRAMESDKTKIEFGSAAAAPRLDYDVNIPVAGSYYVWVRGVGFDGNSDSVHLGVNGVAQESAGNIAIRREGVQWSRFSSQIGASATLSFSGAGAQKISLFMRESGTSVDSIKLTTDKAYRPDRETSIPTISLAPNTPTSGTITEGSNEGITYTLSRSTAFGDLPVSASLFSGTATASDYTVSGDNVAYNLSTGGFTITFKGTQTQASFTIQAKSDAIVEGDEQLTLKIDEPTGDSYRVAQGTQTDTTIKDLPVVTCDGLHVVQALTSTVSFSFSRSLEVYDGEVYVELETYVDTLSEHGVTLPTSVIIPAGVASVNLSVNLPAFAHEQAAVWYFNPVAITPVVILSTIMGIQIAPAAQYTYEDFRQKLADEFMRQGRINDGGANDMAGEELESLKLKALRWTGSQMIDAGAQVRDLGFDVIFASASVLGKLKLVNNTISKLIDAAENAAEGKDKLREALRTLVDRDYIYETSEREITLDSKKYDTHVTWLIDKATKTVVLGEVSGSVPVRTSRDGGVSPPVTTNQPKRYKFFFEGKVLYDAQGKMTSIDLQPFNVVEDNP